MSDDTKAMLTRHMQSVRSDIESVMAAVHAGDTDDLNKALDILVGGHDDDMSDDEKLDTLRDALQGYPLEVVDERGRPFAVVICTGGPHIEVEANGLQSARLAGYWGGEHVYMHGDVFSDFLDYFIER